MCGRHLHHPFLASNTTTSIIRQIAAATRMSQWTIVRCVLYCAVPLFAAAPCTRVFWCRAACVAGAITPREMGKKEKKNQTVPACTCGGWCWWPALWAVGADHQYASPATSILTRLPPEQRPRSHLASRNFCAWQIKCISSTRRKRNRKENGRDPKNAREKVRQREPKERLFVLLVSSWRSRGCIVRVRTC